MYRSLRAGFDARYVSTMDETERVNNTFFLTGRIVIILPTFLGE